MRLGVHLSIAGIFLGALLCIAASLSGVHAAPSAPLLIGTTPVFLDDQTAFLNDWKRYLEARLQRPVQFVQRASYREIAELLLNDKLDFAWVCGYPYVRYQPSMRLVAVPIFEGKPLYRSYVIVPARDTHTKSLMDLRNKVYAYSDPLSNSGWLVPQAELRGAGIEPSTFFRRTFYTWAHRKVVEAVGAGLAQGGSVDGYVWETLRRLHPELTAKTRIVEKSPEYGFPPIVARRDIAGSELRQMQSLLIAMHRDAAGRELLQRLNLTGFEAGSPQLFDSIARNMQLLDRR